MIPQLRPQFALLRVSKLAVILAVVLSSFLAAAQNGVGELRGTVQDETGKPIASATVILQANGETQFRNAQTDRSGRFNFQALREGFYSLRVSADGFDSANIASVSVSARARLAVRLVAATTNASSPSSKMAPQFFDEPQFTVSGVTDTTEVGGHASGPFFRNRDAVEKDVASLAAAAPGSGSPPSGRASNEKALRDAVERNPADFAANHELGRTLVAEGRAQDAIPYLEHAKQLNPGDYQNKCDLALAYANAGEYAVARAQFQSLLAKRETAEAHYLLAGVDEKLGDSLAAVHEYQRAAELDPTETNIFDWGSELLLHHAEDPAVEVFSHGNRLFPRSTRMLIGLGAAEFSAGSSERAVKRLCEASDLNPGDPLPYVFLGKIQRSENTVSPEVIERLHRFLKLQTNNPQANYSYAVAVWKQNQPTPEPHVSAQVESLLKNAVRLDPKFAEAYLQLGVVHAYQKNSAAAISDFQHAIENRPDLQEAHYRLAQAYRAAGNLEQAKAEIKVYEQWAQHSAEQTEREHHEIKQFVYSLQDKPPNPIQ